MASWADIGMGSLGGAGSGAYLGSFLGPIGTGVGAGLGALGGGLASYFSGGGDQGSGIKQASTMTPEQQKALSFLLQQGQEGIQNPYAGFAPIAQQARNQFQQNTIPSLAERFTSMGNSALSSPAFASQLGQASVGLDQSLAALQAQYGMQNQQNSLAFLSKGLTPSFENYNQEGSLGFGENLFKSLIQQIMQDPSKFQKILQSLRG